MVEKIILSGIVMLALDLVAALIGDKYEKQDKFPIWLVILMALAGLYTFGWFYIALIGFVH